MSENWTHPSIVKQGACDINLLRCGRSDCPTSGCNGNLFHCQLCPLSRARPCEIKDHFKNVHWNNRIDYGGWLFCVNIYEQYQISIMNIYDS